MSVDNDPTKRHAELRRQAEAVQEREDPSVPPLSPAEAGRLVHELRTHQIELELQNEELRRSQQALLASRDRYAELFDSAPGGYVTFDDKGRVVEANLTLADLLGVERAALVGHLFSAFVVPDDQDILFRYRRDLLASTRRRSCQVRLNRREGEPFWAELESVLVRADADADAEHEHEHEHEGGGGRWVRTIISDVTERRWAEAEKLALERQLLHAQKLESLGVLAGGIAHDFNNILLTILGNATLAQSELPSGDPTRYYLEEIEHATQKAAGLANQMLAYSGKGHFVIQPVDAGAIVREMAQLLEISISKGAVLRCDLAGRLPTFDGDETQIRQIVMNLIINASEALGPEGGVISLSTGVMACDRAYLDDCTMVLRVGGEAPLPEGMYVYIEVADTGCGMDAETVKKVFEPFFTTKFTGRGLGMCAVLGIVRGHHGALEIHSEVGKGTRLRVLFPARQPGVRDEGAPGPTEVDAAAQAKARAEAEARVRQWRGIGTVLLVDDEESVRRVGQRLIERLGFTVLLASDGQEALKVMEEKAGDVVCVILDLTMPKMGGKEAFRELQRLQPGVPVILVSGYTEEEATGGFVGAAPTVFLQKPFDLSSLRAALMGALPSDTEPSAG